MSVSLSFEVTEMRDADLEEVVEIEDLSNLSRWGYDSYRRELDGNSNSIMLVARSLAIREDNRRILGFLAAWVVSDEMHLNNIATHPGYRRQGVGSQLLREALLLGRMREADYCILEVRVSNTAAVELYGLFHFAPVGRRTAYYTNPVEDALVMKCDLMEPVARPGS